MEVSVRQIKIDFGQLNFYLNIYATEKAIIKIEHSKRLQNKYNDSIDLLIKAETQLKEYFAGKRKKFDLKLSPEGTAFQKNVWKNLSKISFGKIKTYKDIAQTVGSSKAYQAVGGACGKNPIPIIIPCHRVLGSNGSLTGFAWGTKYKAGLLELESIATNG